VAECPEGKELEEGVLIRGAISVFQVTLRTREKTDLAAYASVH